MENFDLEKFKNYVNTYDEQVGHKSYSEKTIILDFLYGIGISINSEEYSAADGFKRFKALLLETIEAKCFCGKPVNTKNPDCVTFSLCEEHSDDA